MLPQTYGPFRKKATKLAARYVIKRTSALYSRDHLSEKYLQTLFKGHKLNGKLKFSYDVGFILDSRAPDNLDIGFAPEQLAACTTIVGLNVSGLLFNGGYTKNNMFN